MSTYLVSFRAARPPDPEPPGPTLYASERRPRDRRSPISGGRPPGPPDSRLCRTVLSRRGMAARRNQRCRHDIKCTKTHTRAVMRSLAIRQTDVKLITDSIYHGFKRSHLVIFFAGPIIVPAHLCHHRSNGVNNSPCFT